MPERPYVVLSCAISLDGYLDSATGERLLLSNAADLDRVDAIRAGCDAILVGAQTIRSDDPRLVLRDPDRMSERVQRGLPPTPIKVTLTSAARLPPDARFFSTGDTAKFVYCPSGAAAQARQHLDGRCTVVDGGSTLTMQRLCADLRRRGVRRMLVEGGGIVHTQFLDQALADELHLVVAPFFVGDSRAVRFVGDGAFRWSPTSPARLVETRAIGEVVLLRYALSTRCEAPTLRAFR